MKFFISAVAYPAVHGFAAISSTAALAHAGEGFSHHMWNGGPWMFFGPLIWIVIIAAVVIGVMYLVRSQGGGNGRPLIGSSKTPREILDERFARGEIDEKEYNDRKRALDS